MAADDISDARVLRDEAGPSAGPQRPGLGFMRRHPSRWIALGFGSGLARWAPGTVGTLWAWAAFVLFDRWLGPLGWAVVIGAALPIGVWACARTAKDLAVADPGAIVWDEVIAFWIVLWLLMPASLLAQASAFVLFRYFDIAKPGPVGWCDRRFKSARGWNQGVGIIADDLVAALCTLLVISLAHFILQ